MDLFPFLGNQKQQSLLIGRLLVITGFPTFRGVVKTTLVV
jgi:hypothetical protein